MADLTHVMADLAIGAIERDCPLLIQDGVNTPLAQIV